MRFNASTALRISALGALAFTLVLGREGSTANPASGIDLSTLDPTCEPCTDFYRFAVGGWQKRTTIPADKSYYGAFDILQDQNLAIVREILDDAVKSRAPTGSNQQKIADYYSSCMDTDAIDRAGITPLGDDFDAIATLASLADLPKLTARLQSERVNVFFSFGGGADFQDSTQNISQIDQGGLGLPDRDYYTKIDDASVALREKYVRHVQTMFALLGEPSDQAAADAQAVLAFETALAQHQLTNVEERDVVKTNNKVTLTQLDTRSPNFRWSNFIAAAGVTPTAVDVTSPSYLSALSDQLGMVKLGDIKAYLRWHVVSAYAPTLSKPLYDANFAFYSTVLLGSTEQLPRWHQCATAVDRNLGEALGQLYVAKAFPPQAKANAEAMVANIESAFSDDLATLSWMSPATRKLAVAKLAAFLIKIGYPDKWRDYSKLTIVAGPYATNVLAARRFEMEREYAQIGKRLDRTEWAMTPPTVNAQYDATLNQISFPAGILQPPFFYANADPAVNYGGIGAVIGHESTHGFDDQGSLYDKNGNLNDQWSKADRAKFTARTQCIVKEFDALSPETGVHENGSLVVGEETADLGGLTIAYKAFEKWQSTHPRQTIDGFTPEQRFFLGWAHVWMSLERPASIKLSAAEDVHAYDKFRVNAIISNMPSFAAAWKCPIGSAMVRPVSERCQIW